MPPIDSKITRLSSFPIAPASPGAARSRWPPGCTRSSSPICRAVDTDSVRAAGQGSAARRCWASMCAASSSMNRPPSRFKRWNSDRSAEAARQHAARSGGGVKCGWASSRTWPTKPTEQLARGLAFGRAELGQGDTLLKFVQQQMDRTQAALREVISSAPRWPTRSRNSTTISISAARPSHANGLGLRRSRGDAGRRVDPGTDLPRQQRPLDGVIRSAFDERPQLAASRLSGAGHAKHRRRLARYAVDALDRAARVGGAQARIEAVVHSRSAAATCACATAQRGDAQMEAAAAPPQMATLAFGVAAPRQWRGRTGRARPALKAPRSRLSWRRTASVPSDNSPHKVNGDSTCRPNSII